MALQRPEFPPARIALVDDSEAVRRSMLMLLETRGFGVDVYSGGAVFIAALPWTRYDCFIFDLKLDDIFGIELLAEVRRLGFHQPAVLISGIERDGLERLAEQSGFQSFVRKPMMERSIIREVERVLSA